MIKKIVAKVQQLFEKATAGKYILGRILKGGVWLSLGSGLEQALRLVRQIIFARLLLPAALGPFAIITAVCSFFESFSEVGIREAIIQNPAGAEPEYLNGAWWFAAFRGVGLFAIGFIAAPWLALFYNNPDLTPMMQVAFSSMLFKGLMSAHAYAAVKKMNFKKWVLIEQLGGAAGVITAIVLAFFLKNVWALVIGFVAESFARTLLSFIVFPSLPRWKFNKQYIKELLHFSRGMFGLPLLTFIFMNADIFVIGKLCSQTDIGLYGWIIALSRIPSLLMQKLLNPLLMPAFSEIQDDKERINKAFLKMSRIFFLVGTPLIVCSVFYGRELLSFIYTPAYGAVAIPFTLLFFSALLSNYNVPVVVIFFSLKKPGWVRLFTGIRALLIVILIYPATHFFSLIGASSAVVLVMIISYIIHIVMLNRITGLNQWAYWKEYIPALLASLPVPVIWLAGRLLPAAGDLLMIGLGTLSVLLAYGIGFTLIRRRNKEVNA